MDATCKDDGEQVTLKSVPARRGQQELEIARRFSSPDLRRDSRNHCVPLLETLESPDTLDQAGNQQLMVMPYLRPVDRHVAVPTSKSSSPHILTPPNNLHPSLSCWIKNMNKLSSLIDSLHKLASAAPAENRSQLPRQVVALRAMFKRQQERFIEFLQLSEELANKYLLNISADIQQQSTILNNLEERLEAAKKLHEEATYLQSFYESGTVDTMKDLRASGKAVPCCLQRKKYSDFIFFSNFAATSTGQCSIHRGGLRYG